MTVELPVPVQQLVDAINAGDTEAFVDSFTSDAVVNDWGRVLTGHDGVRSWAETDAIGQNAQMTVQDATTDGNVTELRFGWSSNRFNGTSSAFATVVGEKVSEFRIPPH